MTFLTPDPKKPPSLPKSSGTDPASLVLPPPRGTMTDNGHADNHTAEPNNTTQSKTTTQLKEASAATQLPFHLSLLEGVGLPPDTLNRLSAQIAANKPLDLARHWILEGHLDESLYYQVAAARLGIPFVGQLPADALEPPLDDTPLDRFCAQSWIMTKPMARLGPVAAVPDRLIVFAPFGKGLDTLAHRLSNDPTLRKRVCLTTPSALTQAQRWLTRDIALRDEVYRLKVEFPHYSAHGDFGTREGAAVLCMFALLIIAMLIQPDIGVSLNFLTLAVFLSIAILRFMAWWELPGIKRREQDRSHRLIKAFKTLQNWPSYTVLVPLYREASVVPDLLVALGRIDYPRDRLEIMLLVEADDDATLAAVRSARLAPPFSLVEIPIHGPRTKPKALNYALAHVQSELLVIFDAEDRPHPMQLREAALHMASAGPKLACLQGRLAVDNTKAGFLSRHFAIEYAALFDGLLPFLADEKLPIPLGGTSNHFRTHILKELGGWDPYNVTEDADLGLRLTRLKYGIEVLLSDTWEEAPEHYESWLKQRTRWLKGWMQTWLVHMRSPRALIRELGVSRFIAFQVMIGGMLISTLIHPVFLVTFLTTLAAIVLDRGTDQAIFWYLVAANGINLLAGYAGAILLAHRAAKRRYGFGLKQMLTLPLYWLMMSPAAWRALVQLIRNPHNWEKTDHGVSTSRPSIAQPRKSDDKAMFKAGHG